MLLYTFYTFNPRQIPGLVCWLNGFNPSANGVIPSVGTSISNWKDISGFNNNFTQSSGGAQFTYTSDQGMLASGAQYMSGPTSGALGINGVNYEIILVAKPSANINIIPVSCANFGNYEFVLNATGPTPCAVQFISNSVINAAGMISAYNNNKTIYDGQASSQSVVVVSNTPNGTASNTLSSAAITPINNFLTIGTRGNLSFYFIGTLYQLLIYKGVLSSTQRTQLFTYLTNLENL